MEYSYHVSIPLSANSNICVSFGLVLVDWSFSFWIMLSCLFTSLIISDWIPDTVNFTLLGDGIYLVLFVSSYKYSWALFTTAAKILRNSLILSGLLRFLRQDQSCSWSRVSNSPLQTQDPSVTLSNNAVNYEVFQFGCWEKALNPALCEPGDYCLHFLGIWFPGLGQSPYMNVLVNNLLNTQEKNLYRSPELARSLHGSLPPSPPCTALSPPVLPARLSPPQSSLHGSLPSSALPWSLATLGCPQLRARCLPASPVFSLSVPQPGSSLRAASRAIRGLTVLVFHPSGITPSDAWGPVSWKQSFRMLCPALWLFSFPI